MVANGLFVYEKVYRNKKFLVTEGQNSKITPKLIIFVLCLYRSCLQMLGKSDHGHAWRGKTRYEILICFYSYFFLNKYFQQFMVGEEICGSVVSIRYQEDILSIWNRSANDTGVTNRIRDTFRRVLNLPPGTTIEYKAHNDSIK